MEILWFLLALCMLAAVVGPFVLRRRGGIRQVLPGSPDAADPDTYGFARQEELDIRLPGPDQDLLDVLDVVQRSQDWRAASQLLAGTPKEGEVRWQRVQAFAGAASLELAQQPGVGGAWLRAWRAEAPKDAGGAAVHAEFLVQQAWRSSTAGTDDFRIILEEARTVCGEAALLAPGDPVPYIVELAVSRGLGYSHEEFDRLWAKVIDRAPAHMGAHIAALHYWCEKWHGSREAADRFATTAAARAPQGSLLAALPLFAVYEHLPEVNLVQGFYRSAVVTKAVEGALFAVHAARADDPMLAHVRHLLVLFLVRMERWSEAMNQFVHIDGHVGALPWTQSPDPAAEYTVYRALAVAGYEANGGSPATLPR
ncbi:MULTISPECIES: hypothetical protein [unclassified Streptomyces]|uniref:hypothetical protein n=1 Tax=unclassified Streptomyces TaxID=2593676 RepID=UPI00224EF8D6|nr:MULTISPECIES: hypothetical protein [unclassified Streptomyces]WSP57136.1 hypothetical protein OG306_24230 [Streptomyces sp. NBC_01241]WSU22146.1 hypothetical protein OG508_15000 [Streptomyces sp. NBC_01108]MCX4788941.1 hypothetical protein [Streptomyces sp. NBC_01221]MCX4795313.1 hypothetical protein [Streptomyces sp. NBC_01242]WSJ36620.1 hypothetical protein OG772_11620 [Streptomyces sp. NBC_01321]